MNHNYCPLLWASSYLDCCGPYIAHVRHLQQDPTGYGLPPLNCPATQNPSAYVLALIAV